MCLRSKHGSIRLRSESTDCQYGSARNNNIYYYLPRTWGTSFFKISSPFTLSTSRFALEEVRRRALPEALRISEFVL
jgi:hypothetical protein